MTEAQQQAFERIEEIMREHFGAGVILVQAESPESDRSSVVTTTWHGGYATAIGLLELGKMRVWNKLRNASE